MPRSEKNNLYDTVIAGGRKGEMFKMRIGMETGNAVIEGIAFAYMCVCAAFDIRHREIPLLWILSGIAAAAGINIWRIAEGTVTITAAGLSLMPGIFFLFIGFGTKEKIGYGDGLLLLAAGLFLGVYRCFLALSIGLVVSAAAALFLLVLHKADRNSRIPFIPFLLTGMGVAFFV